MRLWPVTTLTLLTLVACSSTYAADEAEKPDAPKPDTTKAESKADKKEGKGKKAGGTDAALFKLALSKSAEINLTDEQKEKLLKLKAVVDEQNEKLKNDPELASLHAQMKDARKNDDKDKAKELNKQIRELTDKKSGDALQTALKDADGVLTAEQTAKLKDIQKQEREKKMAERADKGKENAAAPATPPPAEKAADAKPAEAPKTAEAPKPAEPAPADNNMGK